MPREGPVGLTSTFDPPYSASGKTGELYGFGRPPGIQEARFTVASVH
jgi:hypothetical protein